MPIIRALGIKNVTNYFITILRVVLATPIHRGRLAIRAYKTISVPLFYGFA